jgi:hypothetical protein
MYRDKRYADTRDPGNRSSNYYSSYRNNAARTYQNDRSGVSNKFHKYDEEYDNAKFDRRKRSDSFSNQPDRSAPKFRPPIRQQTAAARNYGVDARSKQIYKRGDDGYGNRQLRDRITGAGRRGGKTLVLNPNRMAAERNSKRILIPVPAQKNAEKRGVMPVINPTGNPFLKTKIRVPSDKETLSKLQIKVDL